MSLLQPLFGWDALEEILSDRASVQGMLDFEAALARAEAGVGVIPPQAAAGIGRKCRAELFDPAALATAAASAGNLAIPLVAQLTALVARDDPEAARFVHWGATSQDAIDTGLILQLRSALERIDAELGRLADALARLVATHRTTPAAARTWMQHALPTSFGLRAAGWLDAVSRQRQRSREVRRRTLVVQFGGGAGTLAALGEKGLEVAAALARELRLELPDLAWHAQRDRIAEIATLLGLCTGTLAKIARDVALSAQTEVAELGEPTADGRGGSSTLPHKRNPVASAVVLAAGARVPGLVATLLSAMPQEHERGLGGWHAEWETLPEIVRLCGGALHHLTDAVSGLRVDTARMGENLEQSQGLIFAEAVQMALASAIGRGQAHEYVAAACRQAREQRRHLREVLAADPSLAPHLSQQQIQRLFDPRAYLGVAEDFIDRVLARHSASGSEPRT